MARRYRPRKLFKFWLYRDLVEDTRLMDYIAYLYKTRQFATTVRNGLRLMWTLGEGDLSVLFELFPGLQSKLTPRNDDLIEQFRQMLQAQPIAALPTPALSAGIKPMNVPQIAMPTFDEDDEQDTIIIRRDDSAPNKTSNVFMQAVLSLQQPADAKTSLIE
jgi:hypothetical protein